MENLIGGVLGIKRGDVGDVGKREWVYREKVVLYVGGKVVDEGFWGGEGGLLLGNGGGDLGIEGDDVFV